MQNDVLLHEMSKSQNDPRGPIVLYACGLRVSELINLKLSEYADPKRTNEFDNFKSRVDLRTKKTVNIRNR